MVNKKTWKNLEYPKNIIVRTRIDSRTAKKLDICCNVLQTTRSDVIRRSIEKYYEEIANK